MNIEANRLATFASWPSHFPIDVARIARGGFFATGRELEAECHWCRQRISDWRYGDQVMIRHRQLDPLCPFITDLSGSGNVPMLENAAPAISSEAQAAAPEAPSRAGDVEEPDNRGGDSGDIGPPDYMDEQVRLDTFANWPITCVTPRSLARAGFYYYNQSDYVRCAWCQGVIAKWEQGDDPFVEHYKFFPSCPRAMCGPNVRLLGGHNDQRQMEAIGIQPHQPSRHEAFASLDVRLQTFQTWRHGHVQRPDALAAAGFYYLDADDYVRCFHCSGGLRSWQPDDDPWYEHAKYFPRCGFVELVRGRGFVQEVQAGQRPTLEAAMREEWPRRALEMGFAGEDVRTVVAQRLQVTASPFASIDDLVVAVLSLKVATAAGETNAGGGGGGGGGAADANTEVATEATAASASTSGAAVDVVSAAFGARLELRGDRATEPPADDDDEAGAVGGTAAAVDNVVRCLSTVDVSADERLKSILSGTPTGQTVNLEDENRKLKDAILCKVCMVEEVGIVFLPCGHLVSCVQCASGVAACPLCRTTIKAYVRTYLS